MMTESLIAKAIGTLAGAVLALVFIQPRTRNGFIRRLIVAIVFGPVAAPMIAPYLLRITSVNPGYDTHVASSAVGAFCSWWLLGALRRVAEKFGHKEEA